MVDLAKIRKKAKQSGKAPAPKAPAATPTPTPEARLEKFLAEAGRQRFAAHAAQATAADEVELLTFVLGSERYAIDIEHIEQIISARPATPIPNAPPLVRGILSLRGAMVTLMDVRGRLRQAPRSGESDPRIIVIQEPGGLVGFEVDRVLRPAKVDRASIEPQPVVASAEEREAIRGVIRGEDALTIVLDLSKLLDVIPSGARDPLRSAAEGIPRRLRGSE